jgi:hypothetical protein
VCAPGAAAGACAAGEAGAGDAAAAAADAAAAGDPRFHLKDEGAPNRVCLVTMVKNEEAHIARMLE